MTEVFSNMKIQRKDHERDILRRKKELDLLLDTKTIEYFSLHELCDPVLIKEKITYLTHELKLKPEIKFKAKPKISKKGFKSKECQKLTPYQFILHRRSISTKNNLGSMKKEVTESKNSTENTQKTSTKEIQKIRREHSSSANVNFNLLGSKLEESNTRKTTSFFSVPKGFQSSKSRNIENKEKITIPVFTTEFSTKEDRKKPDSSRGTFFLTTNFTTETEGDKKVKKFQLLKEKNLKLINDIKVFDDLCLKNKEEKPVVIREKNFFLREGKRAGSKLFRAEVKLPINRIPLSVSSPGRYCRSNETSENLWHQCTSSVKNLKLMGIDDSKAVTKRNIKVEKAFERLTYKEDYDRTLRQESAKDFLNRKLNYNLLISRKSDRSATAVATKKRVKSSPRPCSNKYNII